jgi:hydrogenase expression/formation protein HypD
VTTGDATHWLARIRALPLRDKVKVMNVCGGHERSITMAGLRALLPETVELIPGPGCPVCVCPEEDLHDAIRLSLEEDVTLVAFGDMLRVPVNGPRRAARTLEQARARGADVRPIASPREAAAIAAAQPRRPVVFFATGFETTTAPVAALLAQGIPDNLYILLSARRTWPAVAMLLNSGDVNFQALIAPGHVATVMGPEEWRAAVDTYRMPTAVAGFEPASLLAAIHSVLCQWLARAPVLDNCYTGVVRPGGNALARRCLAQTMDVVTANWRGIGPLPDSGYALNTAWRHHDARVQFLPAAADTRHRAGEMPPGCDCAKVVLGKIYPDECYLYGRACTPRTPIGPCMVSDEGACRIWWAYGLKESKVTGRR